MADILKCDVEKCYRKDQCARYNGVPNKLWNMKLCCDLHDLFINKETELEVKDEVDKD